MWAWMDSPSPVSHLAPHQLTSNTDRKLFQFHRKFQLTRRVLGYFWVSNHLLGRRTLLMVSSLSNTETYSGLKDKGMLRFFLFRKTETCWIKAFTMILSSSGDHYSTFFLRRLFKSIWYPPDVAWRDPSSNSPYAFSKISNKEPPLFSNC